MSFWTVIYGTLFAAMLVMVFLGCRWGDTELSVGQSIVVTLGVAAVLVLLILWQEGWFWWVWLPLEWFEKLVRRIAERWEPRQ